MKLGRTVIGFLLSALLLWWTLRGVELDVVWRVLRESNALLFALCTVVGTAIFPIRARKWRPILEPVAGPLRTPGAGGLRLGRAADSSLTLEARGLPPSPATRRVVPRDAP